MCVLRVEKCELRVETCELQVGKCELLVTFIDAPKPYVSTDMINSQLAYIQLICELTRTARNSQLAD